MSKYRRRLMLYNFANKEGNEWDGHVDTTSPWWNKNTITGTFPSWVSAADKSIIDAYPYVLYTSGSFYPRWICSTKPIFVVYGGHGSFYPVVDIKNSVASNQSDNTSAINLQPIASTDWAKAKFPTQMSENYYKNKGLYWSTAYVKIGEVPCYKWTS